MKKTYIAPQIAVVQFRYRTSLLTVSGTNLEGFGNNVEESEGGMSADSREFDYDDE